MKYCVLYNPLSKGNVGAEKITEKLKNEFDGEMTDIVDITKITDYEAFLSDKEDCALVICGGDGTLNRFVNDTSDVELNNELYYFATGNGNDFLRDVGADAGKPVKINQYLENLPRCEVNGKVTKFINGVGYGIDGYCCMVGDELRAKGETDINYTAIAIKGLLFGYKPTNAKITVDGVERVYKKVWIAPSMNGKFYGGGMMPTPDQDRLAKDRQLSLCVFHGSGKLKTLMIFPSIFKGKHIERKKYVEVLSGKEITVEFDSPSPLQIDGETILGVKRYTAFYAEENSEKKDEKEKYETATTER